MKFQGRTQHHSSPAIRDLSHLMKLDVEKQTFRSLRALQNYLIDEVAATRGWPPTTWVDAIGEEVTVSLHGEPVLRFKEVKPRKPV